MNSARFLPNVAGYPEWLERWWVQQACSHYGVHNLADCAHRVEKAIQKLSDAFTVNRANVFSDYQRDPELRIAYGLFYFPQNFVRVQFPLAELIARGLNLPSDRPLRILDLGAGAGAAGFGAAEQLMDGRPVTGCAIDRSESALQTQQAIASVAPQQSWSSRTADLCKGVPEDLFANPDLILFSFSLNELSADLERVVEEALERLPPQGLLLILEPALKETSERVEALRDRIAEYGRFHIWAPCLHSDRCPLLRDGEFWCHEVRRWKIPDSLTFLNRHLHRSIETLKFSFVAISPSPSVDKPAGPHNFRLVSPFVKAKGKWISAGCAADGQRHEYEILRRDCTSENARDIQRLERGDIVELAEVHPAGKALRFTKV